MKKFLHSDWLRAVQFFFKQCRKELIQRKKREQTKHSDWSMINKLTDGQSNLLLSNQAHALDGVIFPDCLIHLRFEIFSCTLLISNHVNFLVQFGINKHLQIFQRPQIALSLRARAISLVLEKFTRALFIPNCTRTQRVTRA